MSGLMLYDVALAAVAEARTVDEALRVRNLAERAKLYARQAKNLTMLADAAEIKLRAERQLGVILQSAKEQGQLRVGRPSKSNLPAAAREDAAGLDEGDAENPSDAEGFYGPVTLDAIGVDYKLSSTAQRWAKLGDAEFTARLTETRDKILSTGAAVVNPVKDLGAAEKQARRTEREVELGARQAALPDKRYGVILADPEWRFEPYSRASGMDRAADNHYPTSDLADIRARLVGDIAADDAVLFLWATAPMLPQALEVMAAWGFRYVSQFVWRKDRRGTGYWNRNEHEPLLVGTRGAIPAPAPGTQWGSVIEAPVGRHSEKPQDFYRLIEAYFPTLPKIELNARAARAGWDAWGFEAPEPEARGNLPVAPVERISVDMADGVIAITRSEPVSELRPDMAGGADGGEAPAVHPADITPFAGRFLPHHDAVLRAAYAEPVLDLGAVAAAIGCTKQQAKWRAKHLQLGRRANQQAAVAAANRKRVRAPEVQP